MEIKPNPTDARKRIWWLASYPKSGNTWVRMFLNCYATGFPVNLNSPFQYATGDLAERMYQLTSAKPICDLEPIDTVYYRSAVLMNFIHMSPTLTSCLKTHHAKLEIENIPLIPPHLSKGALYIIRDPRDVVSSLQAHMGHETLEQSATMMGKNESFISRNNHKALFHLLTSWSSHVDSWTVYNTDVPTTVIRYEDMLEKTEETFRTILGVIGFEIDEERLEFALEQTRFSNLQKTEEKKGFRERKGGDAFFRKGKAGEWDLPANVVDTIIENHGETMKRHGYLI